MRTKTETPQQRVCRLARNTWFSVVGFSVQSEKLVRIKLLERELKEHKKAFGVRYLDLVGQKAKSDQLQACVDEAQGMVAVVQQKIVEQKMAIERSTDETRAKLKQTPFEETTKPVVKLSPAKEEEKIDFVVVDSESAARPSAPMVPDDIEQASN